jgi:hypothetical protein
MTIIRLIVDSFNCVPSLESREECNAGEGKSGGERKRVRKRVEERENKGEEKKGAKK